MNKIIDTEESISKSLKGSKFKYKSKYADYVDGVVERIELDVTWTLDDRRGRLLKESISNREHPNKAEFPLFDKTKGDWNGYKITPTVVTTNGVKYKLDEIILIK